MMLLNEIKQGIVTELTEPRRPYDKGFATPVRPRTENAFGQ